MSDLHKESSTPLHNLAPISFGPWSCFPILRILARGQLVEDIGSHASDHELFSILGAEGTRENGYTELLFLIIGKTSGYRQC